MSVVLPPDDRLREVLERRNVRCLSRGQVSRVGIRPLRVGIVNIMPRAETYEPCVLFPISRTVIPVEPVWIRLRTHRYGSTDRQRLDRDYDFFENVIGRGPLDGLILTGAPVEELAYEQVHYWDELSAILAFARVSIPSTLGLCWGGLALARMLGIDKENYPRKLFGVYETRNLDRAHPITGEQDDVFLCPQSRHAGLADGDMERARDAGDVRLLAHAGEGGYTVFESADGRYLAHLGHPEYEASRLVEEYRRDAAKGRPDVARPVNLDLETPKNRWRSHGLEFFAQWILHLHGLREDGPAGSS